MSGRVKAVLLGLGLGVAPLLLLDLALQLGRAARGEPGTSTQWWSVGVYLLVGAVVALGVAWGRRERLAPAVAAGVLALSVLPGLPRAVDWLPWSAFPVVVDVLEQLTGTVLIVLGAYVYAAVRGPRA